MRIEVKGNLLIITYKAAASATEYRNACCKPNRQVLTRQAILGYSASCEDETIKIILTAAEPIWLYFADTPVGDIRFEEAMHIIENFIAS
jgi:hypothetical protein